ncbi:MAG: protein kinase [Planctomycetota bacterium]
MTVPSRPESESSKDFLAVATQLAMLSPDAAREIARQAATRGITPTEVVLQRGMLDVVELDIVETMLHPGDTVPGYVIEGVIGQGGMGVVYRARQTTLDRVIALKTVLVSRMTDSGAIARFQHEAMTVGRLRHPNIVAAHDFGRHEGRLYFAMELVDGENLEQRIDRLGPLDERTALGILRQAAFGLAYATQQGIIHRDIKPANLLLLDPPEGSHLPEGVPMVKLADFGLAFLVAEADARTRMTSLDTPIGSPNYIAPEQLEGERLDARADIYALGATLYHMLAGVPPFSGRTLAQIIAQKLVGDVEPLRDRRPDLSDEIIELTAWMMTRDPGDRIADYPTLLAHIDSLAGGVWAGSEFAIPLPVSDNVSPTQVPETVPTVPLKPRDGAPETKTPPPFGRRKGDKPPPIRQRRRGWLIAGVAPLLALAAWTIYESLNPRMHRDLVANGFDANLIRRTNSRRLDCDQCCLGVATDEDGRQCPGGTDGTIDRPLRLPPRTELRRSRHFHPGDAAQLGAQRRGALGINTMFHWPVLAAGYAFDAACCKAQAEQKPPRESHQSSPHIQPILLIASTWFESSVTPKAGDPFRRRLAGKQDTTVPLHGIELATEVTRLVLRRSLEELAPADKVKP